jgi:opacity protein-like surface antigen
MSRLSLLALCAVACATLAAAPAAAKPVTDTCTAGSPQVVGGTITAKLSASNVDPVQAQFATCGQAERVMKKVAALGLEQPRGDVGGFYCRPTVFATEPDFVRYICTFKGGDTATFVKLVFAVQYKS